MKHNKNEDTFRKVISKCLNCLKYLKDMSSKIPSHSGFFFLDSDYNLTIVFYSHLYWFIKHYPSTVDLGLLGRNIFKLSENYINYKLLPSMEKIQ